MKKQLEEVAERAIEIRETLSFKNSEERKHIKKIDGVIKGVGLLKYMLILRILAPVTTGGYLFYILFEVLGLKTIPIVLLVGLFLFGYIIWAFKLQLKLYKRTMDKITAKP